MREAAAGVPPSSDAPLFVGPTGWSDGTSRTITVEGARAALLRLLRAAGLTEHDYTWESVRAWHDKTVDEQGATDAQKYRTLRMKKPEQLSKRLDRLSPAPNGEPLCLIDDTVEEDQ